MATHTWSTIQVVLLVLAASTVAQFQTFDDFTPTQQFQQPQQQFQQPQQQFQQPQQQFRQPQRFAQPLTQQQRTATPKVRKPAHKFVDPQSVHISPSSNQGFQPPQGFQTPQQARFPAPQQFVQQAVTHSPTRQFQFDSQFVAPAPAPQEAFQQQPPVFEQPQPAPAPAPAPQLLRTQPREPVEPVVVSSVKAARPKTTIDPQQEEIARHQAETAKYSFQSSVTDTLSDTQHVREEVRDGLALKGVYSYSDGFFKRTVHYEADENGYRVIKEDVEPIGDGPQEDPNGSAEVRSNVGGTDLLYRITAADISNRLRQRPQEQQSFLPAQ